MCDHGLITFLELQSVYLQHEYINTCLVLFVIHSPLSVAPASETPIVSLNILLTCLPTLVFTPIILPPFYSRVIFYLIKKKKKTLRVTSLPPLNPLIAFHWFLLFELHIVHWLWLDTPYANSGLLSCSDLPRALLFSKFLTSWPLPHTLYTLNQDT